MSQPPSEPPKIPFRCPSCQAKGAAPLKLAGREVKCPGCGQPLLLDQLPPDMAASAATVAPPPIIKPTASVPPAPPQVTPSPLVSKPDIWKPRWDVVVYVSVVTFLLTMHCVDGLMVLANYLSLALIAGAILRGIERFTSPGWFRYAVWPVAILAMLVWYQFDWHQSEWSKYHKGDDYEEPYETRFVDYYRRGSLQPFYREIKSGEPDFPLAEHVAEGGYSQTGKQHGPWKWAYRDWDDMFKDNDQSDSGTKFYWYGEEITEGEWHLRNQ